MKFRPLHDRVVVKRVEEEGIIFDDRGYAAEEQRLRPEQLEELVGEV